ncbi:GAF domain-containing protein [Secundilactobacillus oryzae JCM 18671]|uniref:GAF domain-containing protein n=1 Tax=Secundilactobacillus oryzae JCM 18671 TaxID=1291743 RepID=A0A081BIR4_9LACO|nr:GAF domain-containing protein [Secundilactobacillus oryzae]GAK47932.1 GAF domain-containing protein [Secundilactobacillus oryzae JCM 18671]
MSQTDYELLNEQIDALLFEEPNAVANLSNASALLFDTVTDINWAGFYLYNEETDSLDLGPFQGKVACMHIKNGSGVCGTAFSTKTIQRVENVHNFPGHIACDSASNSEIVIPLEVNNQLVGVLDIDSESLDRFSEADQTGLSQFASTLATHLDMH